MVTFNDIAQTLLYVVLYVFLAWLVLGLSLAVGFSVIQERKIWLPRNFPSLSCWGMLKVAAFNFVWCSFCLIGAIGVLVKKVVTLGFSDIEVDAHCTVESFVGWCCLRGFIGRVQVNGTENLPPPDIVPAPTYVANHASQIDVAAVYFMKRRFKWIAKKSVIYLPGVGQIMFLAKHVFIQRSGKNKKSVSNLFQKSSNAIQSGIPMFFFPQGTRWMADRLPFKDGAFIVAQENAPSLMVPLSIDIPRNAWNSSYPFMFSESQIPVVTLTIHPPIAVTDKTQRAELKQQCVDVIYQGVPTIRGAETPPQETKKQ